MDKLISDILLDIAAEQNGYTIGKPWRFTEHSLAAVVPLVRETQEPRGYLLFGESGKVKVKDTGSINELELVNQDEWPVLIKGGEVLEGATQSRAIAMSQVLMPGEKVIAQCACVYSTKGIRHGQGMEVGGYAPVDVRNEVFAGRYRKDGHLNDNYCYDGRIQNRVWQGVKETSANFANSVTGIHAFMAHAGGDRAAGEPLGAGPDSLRTTPVRAASYRTPSEDLVGRMSENQVLLKDVLKNVPKVDNQVGLVMLTMQGLESMELFNHPESWVAIRKAILGADADKIADIADQNGLFEFREDKAKEIIHGLLRAEYEESEMVKKDQTSTFVLSSERFTGEVVVLNDAPIHVAFVKRAN